MPIKEKFSPSKGERIETTKVNRETFLHSLESVAPAMTAPGSEREQTSCFIFKNGRIITWSEEVSCKIPSGLPKDQLGVVEGKPLLESLRSWTEEEVEIAFNESLMTIQGKGQKAKIRMEATIDLPLDSVDKPTNWVALPGDFADAIRMVQPCSGKDETRFYVNCVHLHPKFVEACSLEHVCRWTVDTGIKKSTLIRREAIKGIPPLGMTEISETEHYIHFKNPNGLIYSCRRYMEEFPDMGKFFEVVGEVITLPPSLAETVKRAEIFSVDNDNNFITVALSQGRMKLTGQGIHGEYTRLRKIKWDGKDFSFLVSPGVLTDITKKKNEVILGKKKMMIDGGSYKYVAALAMKEDLQDHQNGDGKED